MSLDTRVRLCPRSVIKVRLLLFIVHKVLKARRIEVYDSSSALYLMFFPSVASSVAASPVVAVIIIFYYFLLYLSCPSYK